MQTGFDRNDQRIHAIGELDRKQIGSLYLMSCNSGHTDLFDAAGINARGSFAEIGDNRNVYAYDGSVSFGTPIIRVVFGQLQCTAIKLIRTAILRFIRILVLICRLAHRKVCSGIIGTA